MGYIGNEIPTDGFQSLQLSNVSQDDQHPNLFQCVSSRSSALGAPKGRSTEEGEKSSLYSATVELLKKQAISAISFHEKSVWRLVDVLWGAPGTDEVENTHQFLKAMDLDSRYKHSLRRRLALDTWLVSAIENNSRPRDSHLEKIFHLLLFLRHSRTLIG